MSRAIGVRSDAIRRIWLAALFIIVAFFLSILCNTLLQSRAEAAVTVPQKMNFQGRLTNNAGNVLANGTYNMRLRLYNAATGGNLLWSEERLVSASTGVTVTNGQFSIRLGDVTPLNEMILGGPLNEGLTPYLEVELPTPATATSSSPTWSEGAMTPRNQLATSAYSFISQYSVDSQKLGGLESMAYAQVGGDNQFSGTNLFTSSTNGANFGILNSSGEQLFVADTSSRRILVGGQNSSSNTTFLVVSRSTQSGDPANGTNGSIYYNESSGKFRCFEAGAWKDCITPAATGGGTTVRLASNTTSSLTANTLADTGLQFTATANVPYRFQAFIMFNAAAATTGSRWTVTGPTLGSLSLQSTYTTTATTEALNYVNAYNAPTGVTTQSLATGNIAIMNGRITTTASGAVKIQFASEVAASAITALAGSSLTFSVDQ